VSIDSSISLYSPLIFSDNTYTYAIPVAQKKKGIFHKLGKALGKSVAFFRKDETKAASMISYWAVETVLFAVIMLTAPTPFVFFSALFLYLYGTYALFSAAMVLL